MQSHAIRSAIDIGQANERRASGRSLGRIRWITLRAIPNTMTPPDQKADIQAHDISTWLPRIGCQGQRVVAAVKPGACGPGGLQSGAILNFEASDIPPPPPSKPKEPFLLHSVGLEMSRTEYLRPTQMGKTMLKPVHASSPAMQTVRELNFIFLPNAKG